MFLFALVDTNFVRIVRTVHGRCRDGNRRPKHFIANSVCSEQMAVRHRSRARNQLRVTGIRDRLFKPASIQQNPFFSIESEKGNSNSSSKISRHCSFFRQSRHSSHFLIESILATYLPSNRFHLSRNHHLIENYGPWKTPTSTTKRAGTARTATLLLPNTKQTMLMLLVLPKERVTLRLETT